MFVSIISSIPDFVPTRVRIIGSSTSSESNSWVTGSAMVLIVTKDTNSSSGKSEVCTKHIKAVFVTIML